MLGDLRHPARVVDLDEGHVVGVRALDAHDRHAPRPHERQELVELLAARREHDGVDGERAQRIRVGEGARPAG